MSRALLLAAAAGILAASLLLAGSASADDDASAFDAQGGGAWPFVADARAAGIDARRVASTPVAALGRVEEPGQALLAVFDAPQAFTDDEAAAVLKFLDEGGRVLLADPYGAGNAVGAPLGVSPERVRLVDPQAAAAGARLEFAGGTFDVNWSRPSALAVASGAQAVVLARSHPGSFLDRDGNGTIDEADPQGSFPLAVEMDVGSNGGRLVVFADAGPFLAAGAAGAENPLLRRALLDSLLPEGGLLLVDESHGLARGPFTAAVASWFAAAALPPWKWVLAGVGALVLAAPLLPDLVQAWGEHRFRPQRFIRRARLAQPAPPVSGRRWFWTRRGTAALAACASLLLLGTAFGRPEAMAAGGVVAVALALSLWQGPARVTATRALSVDRPAEGTDLDVTVAVTATGQRAVRVELRDSLPLEFELTAGRNWLTAVAPAGKAAEHPYTVRPALRGPYRIGPLVGRTVDPLGLRAHDVVLVPAVPVRVAPRQESVRRIPFTTRVPTVTLGPHLVNRAGDGSEFHALREYAQGDGMRSVNWKASARSGGLMVNQRVHESMTRLTLLLDARAVSGAGPADRTPLADGCRAALSVAAGALRLRDRIRVVTYGDGVTTLPYAAGSRQLHDLREVLAGLQAQGNTSLADAVEAIGSDLRPSTPVLVLSGAESDPGFVDAVRALRNRGLLPVVLASPIWLRPPDPEDGSEEDGAQDVLAGREQALAAVRALGVPVYETVKGLPLDELFRIGVRA